MTNRLCVLCAPACRQAGLWDTLNFIFETVLAASMNTDIITGINQSMEINVAASVSMEELRQSLEAHINHLINTDFEKLVFYLYRIDVDETKMRRLLEEKQNTGAAILLAGLIIERQLQKIKSREGSAPSKDIPDEDKW